MGRLRSGSPVNEENSHVTSGTQKAKVFGGRSKITLADLQEQFHYSERYINQKFQKELGTTVIDYLNRCRIQNALELIRKGKLPISQIGWECGIGEYKYFNHVFKKYIGCSVREYQSTLK